MLSFFITLKVNYVAFLYNFISFVSFLGFHFLQIALFFCPVFQICLFLSSSLFFIPHLFYGWIVFIKKSPSAYCIKLVSSFNKFVLFLWHSHLLFLFFSYDISRAIFSFCFLVQVFPLQVPLLSLEVDNYRKSLPNTVPGPTRLSCKAKDRFLQNVHTKDAEIRSFSGENVLFAALIPRSLP